MPSPRLTEEEIWEFVVDAHTGVMTTLRADGMPVALPLWYACIDRTIYVHTRGKKLRRLARDPRASFLVETGQRWAELKAVHLTGTAGQLDPDPELLARIEAENARKYDPYRTPAEDMPAATAGVYASTMRWVRFVPEGRILGWDNAKLVGGR
jgi:nitroimidazol reductase NimA-like FMN-containing flavoprotein (pyridoxamine 5'-phosphate oxidase superfamily)